MEHLRTVAHALCIGAYESHGSSIVVAARLLAQRLAVDKTDNRASDHDFEPVQAVLIQGLGGLVCHLVPKRT